MKVVFCNNYGEKFLIINNGEGRYIFKLKKDCYNICRLCKFKDTNIKSPIRILKFRGIKKNSLCEFCYFILSSDTIDFTIRCGKVIIPPVIQEIDNLVGKNRRFLFPVNYEEIRR